MELTAIGQSTPAVVQSLHREEERKVSLTKELDQLQALANTISLDEKRIAKQLRNSWPICRHYLAGMSICPANY